MCIIRRTDRSIMTDFSSEDDVSLLFLSSEGNRGAEEELIRRYTKLVRLCARRFFLLGGEQEDLIQEGTLGLLNAIRSYRPDAGASFRTYAQRCIIFRIMDISSSNGYKGFLSYEDMDKIVTEGKELGAHLYMMTGGEPTVRMNDIFKLAEKRISHGILQLYFFLFSRIILVPRKNAS